MKFGQTNFWNCKITLLARIFAQNAYFWSKMRISLNWWDFYKYCSLSFIFVEIYHIQGFFTWFSCKNWWMVVLKGVWNAWKSFEFRRFREYISWCAPEVDLIRWCFLLIYPYNFAQILFSLFIHPLGSVPPKYPLFKPWVNKINENRICGG